MESRHEKPPVQLPPRPPFTGRSSYIMALLVLVVAIPLGVKHYSVRRPSSPDEPSSLAQEGPSLIAGVEVLEVPVADGLASTVLYRQGQSAGSEAAKGPVVLCLHGFPDNAASFYAQMDAFSAAGFDVFSPVLRGYEPSTARLSAANYSLTAIVEDMRAIADWIGKGRAITKVHIFGHDWGAMLGYLLATTYPDRVASLTTVAVPYDFTTGIKKLPSQLRNSWYMFFFQLPVLPELWFRTRWHGLRRLWSAWSPSHSPQGPIFESVKHTFRQPGVLEAAIAYYRTNALGMLRNLVKPSSKSESDQLLSAPVPVPTLAIHGQDDGCIDVRLYDITMSDQPHRLFPKGLKVVKVEGAGHWVHQEKPDETNKAAIEWMKHWQDQDDA